MASHDVEFSDLGSVELDGISEEPAKLPIRTKGKVCFRQRSFEGKHALEKVKGWVYLFSHSAVARPLVDICFLIMLDSMCTLLHGDCCCNRPAIQILRHPLGFFGASSVSPTSLVKVLVQQRIKRILPPANGKAVETFAFLKTPSQDCDQRIMDLDPFAFAIRCCLSSHQIVALVIDRHRSIHLLHCNLASNTR